MSQPFTDQPLVPSLADVERRTRVSWTGLLHLSMMPQRRRTTGGVRESLGYGERPGCGPLVKSGRQDLNLGRPAPSRDHPVRCGEIRLCAVWLRVLGWTQLRSVCSPNCTAAREVWVRRRVAADGRPVRTGAAAD